jgi:hypothetical protein
LRRNVRAELLGVCAGGKYHVETVVVEFAIEYNQ